MLVRLHHEPHRRMPMITATDLPAPELAGARLAPVVCVFGAGGRIGGLAGHLPPSWTLRRPRDVDEVGPDDLVLLSATTADEVSVVRAVLPARTRVVAQVVEDAAPEVVAAVLTAGADVCVRGGVPAILAGHLVACHRRQNAGRPAPGRPLTGAVHS